MTEMQPWHHRWQRVDDTADPSWYIRFLDASRRATVAQIQADPGAYYAFLQPAHGLRVLDVGSGTGALLAPLARLLEPDGAIVGIDVSAAMVAEANRRAMQVGTAMTFQIGDVLHLDFPDASFDRAMATQVLVHVDHPGRAATEMARVTRPGGLVAIWEADWETLVIDGPDRGVTRRIANFLSDSLPQGWIGRMLPRLAVKRALPTFTSTPRQCCFRVRYGWMRITVSAAFPSLPSALGPLQHRSETRGNQPPSGAARRPACSWPSRHFGWSAGASLEHPARPIFRGAPRRRA